ncbi:hypothetical protein [Chloroflexus sp.]|uniref:hypothetical protein n=1 Tax=Chloroflexus sp. TaxID=1904827 RepID=UPI002ACDE6A0|nr:hypothetical protein [Chloroflexus sp.]
MPHTAFRPEEHGFAFVNAWPLLPEQTQELRQTLSRSAQAAARDVRASIGGFDVSGMVQRVADMWADANLPTHYGMCGGMAFVAADYFRAGVPLPRGRDLNDLPLDDSPRSRALRDYLWQRQVESFVVNAPQLIAWMVMLHLPLPFAGPRWLLERTKAEWRALKAKIDAGEPWPICLIGSSRSPFDNHQVLAIGYDQTGSDIGVISVYDMNSPGRAQTITLDMRGRELEAVETSPSPARGRLRGFFVEQYTPKPPPQLPD